MREDKIIDAMNYIDEQILYEAWAERRPVEEKDISPQQPLWLKWRKGIAVVAAVCLICAGLSTLLGDEKGEPIYGESFEGYAGCGTVCSEEELETINSANPMAPLEENGVYIPATLPVYKNLSYSLAGEPFGLSDGQMLDLLEDAANALGVEVVDVNREVNPRNKEHVYYYYAETGNVRIEAEADGLITIKFKDAIEVEEDFSEAYAELLGFEEAVVCESSEGNYVAFDGKGTLTEDAINYFFAYAEFFKNEEGKITTIRIHNELMAAEKMGDYFYIPATEAKEKLYKGEYYTNSGYGIYENSPIEKVELVYINSRTQEYFMPYYCFYIEIDDEGLPSGKYYGMFYVPAVESVENGE